MKTYLLLLLLITLFQCNPFETDNSKEKNNLLSQILVLVALEDLNEEFSGGETTVFDTTSQAFQRSAQNMTDVDRLVTFARGHATFNVVWLSPGNSANPGLGPTFNANSCNACHSLDGRGKPSSGITQSSLLFRMSIPGKDGVTGGPLAVPDFGDQFNPGAISGVFNEGTISVSYSEESGKYSDGESYTLRRPSYTVNLNSSIGSQPSNLLISPRIAQQNYGLGLLEAISEETILMNADPTDKNGDGISGKANYAYDPTDQTLKLGRFGWKANQPNVNSQNQGAFLGDIGITSPVLRSENCPGSQSSGNCGLSVNTGKGVNIPEVTKASMDGLNLYMKTIAVPGRRNWKNETVLRGKQLMTTLGCTGCHISKIFTGNISEIPEISSQVIRPYTDLLLHDMGEDLSDNRPDFLADGKEWRTPPLWGVGLIKTVNGHDNLLHDGRARGFSEAILWHGGEAESAKIKFKALSKQDRDALVTFLESL